MKRISVVCMDIYTAHFSIFISYLTYLSLRSILLSHIYRTKPTAVADYMQLPGMYPKIGGKIANGGPYGGVKDIYKLKNLSAEEVKTIKKYENKLACTPATGLDTLRGRDPYRRSFSK